MIRINYNREHMVRVTGGISKNMKGTLGGLVYYRQMNGKTFASAMPKPRKKVKWDQMPITNVNFIMASEYARRATRNPEWKAIYQAMATGMQTAYSMAIADYLKPPQIGEVSLKMYLGRPGDKIGITVVNTIRVEWVRLSIENAEGITIEQGEAKPGLGFRTWTFTTTVRNPVRSGTCIHVSAMDFPGHLATREIHL